MELKSFVKNVQTLPLDVNNEGQKLILKDLYDLNKKWLNDDSLASFEQLIFEIDYSLNQGDIGFLFFVNGLPYGVIYAFFDRYKNAEIHGVTYNKFDNMHFFLTQRILKLFIKHLFEKLNVNKIKCEFPIFNKNAEVALRYAGFKKEGHLLGEQRINGKPITCLRLGYTKEKYFSDKQKTKPEKLNERLEMKKIFKFISNKG